MNRISNDTSRHLVKVEDHVFLFPFFRLGSITLRSHVNNFFSERLRRGRRDFTSHLIKGQKIFNLKQNAMQNCSNVRLISMPCICESLKTVGWKRQKGKKRQKEKRLTAAVQQQQNLLRKLINACCKWLQSNVLHSDMKLTDPAADRPKEHMMIKKNERIKHFILKIQKKGK